MHGIAAGDRIAFQEVIKKAGQRCQFAPDRRSRQTAMLELGLARRERAIGSPRETHRPKPNRQNRQNRRSLPDHFDKHVVPKCRIIGGTDRCLIGIKTWMGAFSDSRTKMRSGAERASSGLLKEPVRHSRCFGGAERELEGPSPPPLWSKTAKKRI
ncbi:hypothetical protein ALQ72_100606 [Pseudomonas syringae pv. maculicola]|uniref:Uncharacterized protein n=1 Tax=Pseudomonas syringae pv. maculicola TaxID=59511 RepID=A0A3M3HC63_PSEYM|nr:hypothetical protein ALQ72_100606 [Pseudomonas syringae pv. maculicola]RMV29768.1 hypothetical protein ALP13_103066 [Pseudomonas syringae pv. maculicola]